jgi:hypothetical protein
MHENYFLGSVGKRPSAALPSSLVIAAYFYVRLIPRNFGSLASGHFPSASQKPVFRQSLKESAVKRGTSLRLTLVASRGEILIVEVSKIVNLKVEPTRFLEIEFGVN